jgi:hypothetical protein
MQSKMDMLDRQIKPLQTLIKYKDDPNFENFRKVLKLEGVVDKSLNEVREQRTSFLTQKDRMDQADMAMKETEANRNKATFDTLLEVNRRMGENPDASESEIRKWTAEAADATAAKYGATPDINAVQQRIISQKQQVTSLTNAQQTTIAEAEQVVGAVDSLLTDYNPAYVGAFDNKKAEWQAMLPQGAPEWMKMPLEVQEYRQRAELVFTQYRKIISGSSLTEGEQKSAMKSIANLSMGDDQYKAALTEMKKWQQKAIEANKKAANKSFQKSPAEDPYKAGSTPPPAERSFDNFKSWYQQNKGKFASPDEAARAYRQGG